MDLDTAALDRWITTDPRDREYGPCTCGHDADEHVNENCMLCRCDEYYEDDEDHMDWDSYNDAREEDY